MIERVVELAQVLEGLDHAPDLVVVVGGVGGEDLDLADVELLLLRRQLVPLLQHVLRPGRQLGVLRDHAEALLVLEDALAHLVPALVEQVHRADLVHPLLGRVVRRVRGAGRVLDEDRLAGVGLMNPRHPVDGLVRHSGDEIPPWLALERIDLRRVAKQVRLPLVGVAADEAVEVLEAHAGRPLVERPDLAGRERRRVVVLAKPRCGIAVVEQDAADRRLVPVDDAVVAGEAGRLLGDHAEAGRVMVAARDQRGACRRAQRGREDPVVAQARVSDAVHGRRRNDAAEGAGYAEAGVVGDDQQHVRRPLRWHHPRRPPGLRLQRVILDDAAELRVGRRELGVGDGGRRTRRAERAGDLLRERRRARQGRGDKKHEGDCCSSTSSSCLPPNYRNHCCGNSRPFFATNQAVPGKTKRARSVQLLVVPLPLVAARANSAVRITCRTTAGHSSMPFMPPAKPR